MQEPPLLQKTPEYLQFFLKIRGILIRLSAGEGFSGYFPGGFSFQIEVRMLSDIAHPGSSTPKNFFFEKSSVTAEIFTSNPATPQELPPGCNDGSGNVRVSARRVAMDVSFEKYRERETPFSFTSARVAFSILARTLRPVRE